LGFAIRGLVNWRPVLEPYIYSAHIGAYRPGKVWQRVCYLLLPEHVQGDIIAYEESTGRLRWSRGIDGSSSEEIM